MPLKSKSEMLNLARQMQAYVEKNYTQPLTLADVGRHFGYTPEHVCRLLKKHLGMGFVDCLWGARLRKAKRLLRQTRLPIYEIAPRCGFKYKDHFFKVFKKVEGITPRKYRLQRQISGD